MMKREMTKVFELKLKEEVAKVEAPQSEYDEEIDEFRKASEKNVVEPAV